MIIDQVDVADTAMPHAECDAPISGNRHGPLPFAAAPEGVEFQARDIEVLRGARAAHQVKHTLEPVRHGRGHLSAVTLLVQPFEATMTKTVDHDIF